MTTAAPAVHPHGGGRVATGGPPPSAARGAIVLVHGRGGSADDILELGREVTRIRGRDDLALVAPQASGNTWYPLAFLAPMAQNEPYLSSALARVGEVMADLAAAGIGPERTLLVGFSQGACLTLEWAARNASRFGGIGGVAGGLIGPPGTPRAYAGSFAGTPVFLGCGVPDAHIPKERVEETAAVLGALGARVTKRLYPGAGHAINADELQALRELAAGI